MKRTLSTALAILGLLAMVGLGSAQTSGTASATTSVTALNTLEVTAGGSLNLTLGEVDDSTQLTYSTNDGTVYTVKVAAAAWTFTPSVEGNSANGYPTLAVTAVTDSKGNTTATGTLIDAENIAGSVDLVTGIQNEAGTVDVSLQADGDTVSLVAGDYDTTLTYTLE